MLTSLSTLRLMLTTLLLDVCLTLPVPMEEIKELSGDEAVLTLTPSFLRIVFTELMLTPPLADVAPEADCGVEGLLDSVVLALVALLEAFELAVAAVAALVLVVLAEAAPPTPGVDGGVLNWACCCWSFWRMVDEMDSLMEAADETAETRSAGCLDSTCCWADWSIWEMSVDCCRICCCCCCCCIWVCCCG